MPERIEELETESRLKILETYTEVYINLRRLPLKELIENGDLPPTFPQSFE
jgi:hypothetical protein